MSRQLKFRIYDTIMKRWLCEDSQYLQMDGKKVHAAPWSTIAWDIPSDRFIIQQFTGLNDKNGKDIYEGDILQELRFNETVKALGVCKEVLGGWSIFSIDGSYWHGWKQVLIGNIFENSELL